MKPARVRSAADADPIRREIRRTARFSALIRTLDRFFFDPTPTGESIWKAIFFALAAIVIVDIIQAALRGRGFL